jgi:hypothetical protein
LGKATYLHIYIIRATFSQTHLVTLLWAQVRLDFDRGIDFLSKLSRILLGGNIQKNLVLADVVSSLNDGLKEIANEAGRFNSKEADFKI